MLKSNEGFLSILLTIIITALLVGGGVYYYQKTVFDNSIKEAVKNVSDQTTLEIDQLKSQIEELEKEAVVEDVVDDTASWQTYKNSWIANYSGPGGQLAFDFQFKYPTNLKVDGDNLYRFIRENNSEDGFLVRVSAQTKGAFEKYKKDQNKPKALLDDFIINEVSCAADGAGVSIYCKDAMIYEQGTSKNGIKYFVLSMKEITTYSDDRPDQEKSRGPIYVLDVREQTKGEYELLFFSPESKGLTYSGLGDILKGIVDSFSFPTDISDWQTYTNNDLGLSFKYPVDFTKDEFSELFGQLFKSKQGHFWLKIEDNVKNFSSVQEIKDNYYANDSYGYQYKDSFLVVNGLDIYKQGRYDLGVIEKYYLLSNNKLISISFEFNFEPQTEELINEKKAIIEGIINTMKIN